MLSVRSRDEGRGFGKERRKGLGFGGGGHMEENELEEGEACSYRDEDCGIHEPDVDVDLSYIDDKIRDVLGHFQKDFEGGVSAENLGAKFGGYGSFLPTYQRSPLLLSHSGSSARGAQHSSTPNRVDQPLESARQNLVHQANPSLPSRSAPAPGSAQIAAPATSLDADARKEPGTHSAMHYAVESSPKCKPAVKPSNGNGQTSLKVRFKVPQENVSARDNAAIYSGLGLDVSPSSSSSPEDSSDYSPEVSPAIHDAPDESPKTMLEAMTSLPIPGVPLLSPLNDGLLRLMEREMPLHRDGKSGTGQRNGIDAVSASDLVSGKDFKGHKGKTTKPVEKSGKSSQVNHTNAVAEEKSITPMVKKETDVDTPEGKERVLDTLKPPLLVTTKDKDKPKKVGDKSGKSGEVKHVNAALDEKGVATMIKKEVDVDAPEGKEIVSNDLELPSLVTTKDKSHNGKNSGLDARKGACKLSDLFGEQHTKVTDEKFSVSDPAEADVKEIPGSPGIKAEKVENERLPIKGKLTLKTNLSEKTWEDQKELPFKDNAELKKDVKDKTDAKFNASKDFVQEIKSSSSGIESPKHKSTERTLAYDNAEQKAQEGKDCLVTEKKQKDSQRNRKSASDSSKERSKGAPFKHKKKGTHARDEILESHPDMMRLQELNKRADRQHQNDPTRDIKNEHVESRLDSRDNYVMDKTVAKTEHFEREPYEHLGKPHERLDARRFENVPTFEVNGEAAAPSTTANGLVSEADSDHWVCCDKCQKWRLHPEHISLPKKWICSMQSWLPGLNKCNVTEQDAINAFYALYRIQDHQSGLHAQNCATLSVTNLADAHHDGQSHGPNLFPVSAVSTSGKKKHMGKETQNALSLTIPAFLPSTTKKGQQNSVKSRSLKDVNQYPSDSALLDKDAVQCVVEDREHVGGKQKQKQKEKHKSLKNYSNGGDYLDQGVHSKSKSKRGPQQDNHKTSKKVKIDGLPYVDEAWNSRNEIAGKNACNGIQTKLIVGNGQMYNDDNREYENNFGKKVKDQAHSSFNGECNVYPGAIGAAELDKNEMTTKKRKMKEWQESQEFAEGLINKEHCCDVRDSSKEVTHESEHRKGKKTKSSKCDGRESSTTSARMENKGKGVQVILDSCGDRIFDVMEDGSRGIHEKDHQLAQLRGCVVPKKISEGTDSLKKEIQLSAGAASSSSKVSGSRKIKANIQEVKGSPVESVSSSPLRISSVDKTVSRKNFLGVDEVVNAGLSTGSSPRRCSDGEVDGGSSRSAVILKEKTYLVEHTSQDGDKVGRSSVRDAHREGCDSQGGDRKKIKYGMLLKTSDDTINGNFSRERCNSHLVNGINELERQNQVVSGIRNKDNDLERKSYATANGSGQTKSEKGSSLRKDKQLVGKSDSVKGKFKASDSCRENHEEFYSTKNVAEVVGHAHDGSSAHEELRDGISRHKGKSKSDKDVISLEIKDSIKCSSEKRRDINSMVTQHENSEVQDSMSSLKQQSDSIAGKPKAIHCKDGKSGLQPISQSLTTREGKRSLSPSLPERIDRDLASGKGSAKLFFLSEDRQEVPKVTLSSMGTKVETFLADASNGDASKLLKQPRRPDNGSLRHPAVNGIMSRELHVRSPVRKENGQTALKEAKDLKHSADRLKNGGQERESIGLYFRAALKFLHGASLLEPNDVDIAKQGDSHSMHVYVDTARLCEFCAHFYERHKDLAAAALAYKCMEVAYMRVIFLKHSYTNRARHELQAALPNLTGESPSSSASDIDNLNNPGMSEKALQVKGVGSPQRPSSLVINSRNRRSFDYLLNLASDVNSAMEALRKSQNAFAAANASLEDAQFEGRLSSVRRAIEFNFHDVERLLHLIRLAMEEISH